MLSNFFGTSLPLCHRPHQRLDGQKARSKLNASTYLFSSHLTLRYLDKACPQDLLTATTRKSVILSFFLCFQNLLRRLHPFGCFEDCYVLTRFFKDSFSGFSDDIFFEAFPKQCKSFILSTEWARLMTYE